MLIKFFLLFLATTSMKVPDYVLAYHNTTDKKQELEFINKYKKSTNVSVKAYVICCQIKQAQYKFFPWKKLEIFNNGKKRLETLIKENPNNVDLHYIRLLLQENIPSILNYKGNIKEDKLFLKKKLNEKDGSDYLDFYIKKYTSL